MELAKVVKKIVFNVPIETKSPLRISSGIDDGITDILVLKDKNNRAFIPGTSIAGVLRSKISDVYNERVAQKLFGSVDDENSNQSMINISDIKLDNTKIVNRDGIKINYFSGVSEKGAKYDFEAIDRGATGILLIEITVRRFDLDDRYIPNISYLDNHKKQPFAVAGDVYGELAATLADILTTGINIGALTTKGFGRIKSVKPAEFYTFDFNKEADANAWFAYLDGKYPQKATYTGSETMEVMAKNDFIMQMDFALKNAMIIRDYDSDLDKDADGNKIAAVQMKSGKDYVIPGTSIKGVLKSRAYRILMLLKNNDENAVNIFLDELMGKEADKTGKDDAGQKSNLYVDEVYLKAEKLHSMKQSRNRIDRFTGGTIDSALFTDIPIWQTDKSVPTVSMKIRVKNCKSSQAGLMLLLLKDLWLGNLNIGGNKAIGRGVLQGKNCKINYDGNVFVIKDDGKFSVQASNDKPETLQEYVEAI